MKLISFDDEITAKRVELYIPHRLVPYGDTENFEAYLNYDLESTRKFHPIRELRLFYTNADEVQIVIVAERHTARLLARELKSSLRFAVNNAECGPEWLAASIARHERYLKRYSTDWLDED